MNYSAPQALLFLLTGISLIVILTAKFRLHAFFPILIAAWVVGLGVHMPVADILNDLKEGFGGVMRSLGLIVVLGTVLGILLEYTGSSRIMADFILQKVGERHAALGISITGFIIGLPIFCDAGFIVLSGLTHSFSKRTGIPMLVLGVSLSTALLSVHCMVPPHPGSAAAAAALGVDLGKLMMAGILISIPAMDTGYLWALRACKLFPSTQGERVPDRGEKVSSLGVLYSFLPVVIPILLIALRSILLMRAGSLPTQISGLLFLGDPVIALSVGVILALGNRALWTSGKIGSLLEEAAEKAGGILVIIGAGGAFGAVLAACRMGEVFSRSIHLEGTGIFFPFLVTCILKTAQGSSTVAIITASAIIVPLLPLLGLDNSNGRLLCVLAMGAGSMMISHANDAYFWVIARFSGIAMKSMLRFYSVATLWMGLITLAMVYLYSLLLK